MKANKLVPIGCENMVDTSAYQTAQAQSMFGGCLLCLSLCKDSNDDLIAMGAKASQHRPPNTQLVATHGSRTIKVTVKEHQVRLAQVMGKNNRER